jgi:hypothetical protein
MPRRRSLPSSMCSFVSTCVPGRPFRRGTLEKNAFQGEPKRPLVRSLSVSLSFSLCYSFAGSCCATSSAPDLSYKQKQQMIIIMHVFMFFFRIFLHGGGRSLHFFVIRSSRWFVLPPRHERPKTTTRSRGSVVLHNTRFRPVRAACHYAYTNSLSFFLP